MEIGGYHGLEFQQGKEYYPQLWALNTARNALELILRGKNVSKILIPYYTCEVLLEPLKKCGVLYEYYAIDSKLEIDYDVNQLTDGEYLLYTNYFGVKSDYVRDLASQCSKRLILDNSQAFFSTPFNGIPTFYSCRKFFGVADGAYLSMGMSDEAYESLPIDNSYQRMSHLLKRADLGAEHGYADFKRNDDALMNNEVKKMSALTRNVLQGVNYQQVRDIRRDNFNYLLNHLQKINQLELQIHQGEEGAMAYPFLTNDNGLRQYLIENKIFVPIYWPNVKEWVSSSNIEWRLAHNLLALPIDQRYGIVHMEKIVNTIEAYLNGR